MKQHGLNQTDIEQQAMGGGMMDQPDPMQQAGSLKMPAGIVGLYGRRAASLALELVAGDRGFRLTVLDRHGRKMLSLGPYAEEDIVAEWRALSAASGLVRTMLLPNGSRLALQEQIGPVVVGEMVPRQRPITMGGRRGSQLSRRRAGRLSTLPMMALETGF